jgi:membrane protease subunit (stomatin/prohibitin family)
MRDNFQQILSDLIGQQGIALCENPERCHALLRDFASTYHREIPVVVQALHVRVHDDLLKLNNQESEVVLLTRLTKRVQDAYALPEAAARYAVESWAFVLGVIQSDQCVTRFPMIGSASTAPAGSRNQTQSLTCAACGRTHPIDEIYCQHCTQQLSASRPCLHCQQPMPVNARFCPACGKHI